MRKIDQRKTTVKKTKDERPEHGENEVRKWSKGNGDGNSQEEIASWPSGVTGNELQKSQNEEKLLFHPFSRSVQHNHSLPFTQTEHKDVTKSLESKGNVHEREKPALWGRNRQGDAILKPNDDWLSLDDIEDLMSTPVDHLNHKSHERGNSNFEGEEGVAKTSKYRERFKSMADSNGGGNDANDLSKSKGSWLSVDDIPDFKQNSEHFADGKEKINQVGNVDDSQRQNSGRMIDSSYSGANRAGNSNLGRGVLTNGNDIQFKGGDDFERDDIPLPKVDKDGETTKKGKHHGKLVFICSLLHVMRNITILKY